MAQQQAPLATHQEWPGLLSEVPNLALGPHRRSKVPSLPNPANGFGLEVLSIKRGECLRQGCWKQSCQLLPGPSARQESGRASDCAGPEQPCHLPVP